MKLIVLLLSFFLITVAISPKPQYCTQSGTPQKNETDIELKLKEYDQRPLRIFYLDFDFPAYSNRTWPFRIDDFVKDEINSTQLIRLSITSNNSIVYFFSKCGTRLANFTSPINKDIILDPNSIAFLYRLQQRNCENSEMEGYLELTLASSTCDVAGRIEFRVLERATSMFTLALGIRFYAILMLLIMVVGSFITTIMYLRGCGNNY